MRLLSECWKSSGRKWTAEAAGTFDDPKAQSEARREFLASDVGIGIDIFFGGGAFDFEQQADAGRLVDCEIIKSHPDWFRDNSIPHTVSGEIFYDAGGRWIGAVLSSFGYLLQFRFLATAWRERDTGCLV